MVAPRSPHYSDVLRILRYLKGIIFDGLQVIPLIVALLQDIVLFRVILLSLGEARNKQLLLIPALKHNMEHWQLPQLNLFGYVGYYRILVLTIPLQLNFTVIIEVLFKLLIIMSSMNVLNILRQIVTSFVIICFRVHSHFSLFPLKIN